MHDPAHQQATGGGQVIPVQSDLRTAAGVEQVGSAVTATGRPLAIALLKAGVAVGGAFVDTDLESGVVR